MPHLRPSTLQGKTLVLADLSFSTYSDSLERSSSPGHGHFLCLLLGRSLSHGSESESKLFTDDTSKDNHSPGPVVRGVSP